MQISLLIVIRLVYDLVLALALNINVCVCGRTVQQFYEPETLTKHLLLIWCGPDAKQLPKMMQQPVSSGFPQILCLPRSTPGPTSISWPNLSFFRRPAVTVMVAHFAHLLRFPARTILRGRKIVFKVSFRAFR
uniref:Putative secreted protein n=1 Tax=Anopheles darlingi TaxID=43151 RepID=A0A2M4DNS1_ANODA